MSRDGLFKVPARIACPQGLLSVIQAFHTGMNGVIQIDGSSSTPFDVKSGVKQGCVLAPTLFGIYFAVMPVYMYIPYYCYDRETGHYG